ncbi:hypothetical protein DRN69_07540 [Candidatus Pacearchaeota archaeon]|mgnify:CR=1 FL=1|nr:MAG: hypothetical protein DRN69_07540 [Candidatus Pacearchaeota archaeon]
MNKKKIFQILTLIFLIAWFGVYLYRHFSEFRELKIVSPTYFIPLFLLFLLFLTNNGLILKYLLEPFRIKLKFKEWFGLPIITAMGNFLTPFRGGMGMRAFYLKKIHQFSYSYFLSTLAGLYVIIFLVNSLVGLLTMALLYFFYETFNILIFTIFLCFFLFLLGIVFFSPKFKETKYPFINKFINIINGWHLVKSDKKVLMSTILISGINIIIMATMMFLEFKVFGISISLLSVLFLSIVSTLGLFISITPGALGIKETIVAFVATVVDIPIPQILAVSILDRVVGIGVIFILGPIFSYILMSQKL